MERWQGLDTAAPADALTALSACCGSSRWAGRMVARRPFGSRDALLNAAREEWWALSPDDWLEAFSHHPRIGDRASLAARFPATHHLSAREQAAVGDATEDVLTALADANQAYVDRFGFIFIVCATGKTANEMLELLRERLPNDRDTELRIAAEEQARITELRLDAP
jgi:2-oxo-4-hydroxy-4-carboxy-5-ureidoimidazoline decarboxylase